MPKLIVQAEGIGYKQGEVLDVSEERFRRWCAKELGRPVYGADKNAGPIDSLEVLGLHPRAVNDLRAHGYKTLAAVAEADAADLEKVWGVNADNVAEIQAKARQG